MKDLEEYMTMPYTRMVRKDAMNQAVTFTENPGT